MRLDNEEKEAVARYVFFIALCCVVGFILFGFSNGGAW